MKVARDRLEPWAGVLATLGAAALVATMAFLLREKYLGDPAIYLPFAENAADLEPFTYNDGEFSSGSTSPIWPLLLAPAYVVGAGAGGAKVMSLLVALAAVALVALGAYRVSGSAVGAGLASFAVTPLLGLLGAVLYETPLVIALVGLSVVLGARVARREEPPPPRALLPLAATWAALPLARPDTVMLVAAQVIALALFGGWAAGGIGERVRRAAPIAAALALAAIPSVAYFGYSEAELGTFSTSSQAREFVWDEYEDLYSDAFAGPLRATDAVVDHAFTPPFGLAFVPGLVGLALTLRRRELRWMGAYGAGAVAAYLLVLTFVSPVGYETRRYFMPVVPLVVAGLAWLVGELWRGRARIPALVAAAGLVVVPAIDTAVDETRVLRGRDYRHAQIVEAEAADHVNRLARPGDVALAYEVQVRDAIRDDVDVLSLDGATDGEVHPYLESADMAAFLRRHRPRFWIAAEGTGRATRPYIARSILNTVLLRFKSDARLRETHVAGIGFRLVARRRTPMPAVFGGWTRLFELDYGAYRSQVVAFMEDEYAEQLDSEAEWERVQVTVADAIKRARGRG
jgi:hypothetical protein